MRGRRAAIAAFVAALSAPTVTSAGESDGRAYVPPAPAYDWTVTLGVEGREEPLFQGSSRERLLPYPIFAVRRYGTPEPFRGPSDGLDVALIDEGRYQVGPVGQFVWSQRENANSPAVRSQGTHQYCAKMPTSAAQGTLPRLRTAGESAFSRCDHTNWPTGPIWYLPSSISATSKPSRGPRKGSGVP